MTEPQKDATLVPPPEAMPVPRRRSQRVRVQLGLNAALVMVFTIVLVGVANYLAARHYRRIDWTRNQLYTLSPRTKSLLRSLRQDVRVNVFTSRGSDIYGDMRELFSRYQAESDKVTVSFIDPDLQRARFEMLQKKYNVQAGRLPDGQVITDVAVVVEAGEKHWFVTQNDMEDVDFSEDGGGGAQLAGWKAEQALTSAIVNVTRTRATKICFTKGHEERNPEEFGEGGLSHFADALKRDNFQIEVFETYRRNRVPEGCDAVVVAGPERPFAEEEAALLRSYLRQGGSLLLLLDPIIDGSRFVATGLEAMCSQFGVKLDEDLVLETDPQRLTPVGGAETFVLLEADPHALTDPFKGLPLVTSIARSVRTESGGEGTTHALWKTSKKAWGETDLAGIQEDREPSREGSEPQGPLHLGVAVELPERGENQRGGRLVVFGDSDFISRELFEQPTLVNGDAGYSMIAWLAARQELVEIAAKDPDNVSLDLTEDSLNSMFFYSVVCIPIASAALGIAIWWRRRR